MNRTCTPWSTSYLYSQIDARKCKAVKISFCDAAAPSVHTHEHKNTTRVQTGPNSVWKQNAARQQTTQVYLTQSAWAQRSPETKRTWRTHQVTRGTSRAVVHLQQVRLGQKLGEVTTRTTQQQFQPRKRSANVAMSINDYFLVLAGMWAGLEGFRWAVWAEPRFHAGICWGVAALTHLSQHWLKRSFMTQVRVENEIRCFCSNFRFDPNQPNKLISCLIV